MSKTSARHDLIDTHEDLREEAKEIVEGMKAKVLDIAKDSDDFPSMLEEIALHIENEMAAMTTKAALSGFYRGVKIAKAMK